MQATRDASPQSYVWKWEESALVDAILGAAASSATGRRGMSKYIRFPVGHRRQRRQERGVQPVHGLLDHVLGLLRAAAESAHCHNEGLRVPLQQTQAAMPPLRRDQQRLHRWP